MTTIQMIDDVQMYLTMGGAIPSILPEKEIRRIITKEAMPYFYENVDDSLIKSYYYIPNSTLQKEEFTQYSYITLPCEVQSVTWLYQASDRSLFELGVSAPNLSVNMGATTQPFVNSAISTIGELGVYKVIIDGFADMLNQFSKVTFKYDYNHAANRLHILTSTREHAYTCRKSNLVIECYVQIPQEDLYESDLFKRYIRAKSEIQLGKLLTRYDYELPGGVKINSSELLSEGKSELDRVLEDIKRNNSGSSFFFMVNR